MSKLGQRTKRNQATKSFTARQKQTARQSPTAVGGFQQKLDSLSKYTAKRGH
jgi:hypothetical protein